MQVVLVVTFLLGLIGVCQAQDENIWEQETLTNGFWGLNDQLADSGIELGFAMTSVYQANVKGGISTNQRRGRHAGRYDLEMSIDLEKLLGIEGGSFFMHGWGGWPDTEGIDGHSVGSAWGINALAIGDRSMDIVEAFYKGPFFSDDLTIAIGKLDFTGIFDASEYADDECAQFLNASLVDDPTIPFAAHGLGIVLTWDITDSWYIMGGIADAEADRRETGFETTFGGEDYFFYAIETGITDGSGTYRVGFWVDPQPKANSGASTTYRKDVGVYMSLDRMLIKENSESEDTQGLGGFFRYGYADDRKNDITNFFSLGFQYQGLFDGRDDDVFGVGYSHGTFSNAASSSYPEDYESVLEAYYNAQVTPWFVFGPSIQYVANPSNGDGTTSKDAVIFGLRAQMTF